MISNSDAPILGDAARLPFLCELGWHTPGATPRWNNGYYFTPCARCGRDLIRTAFGKWHVPRGYRVVWQAERPSDTPSAALAPLPKQPDPSVAEENDLEQRIVRQVIQQLRDANLVAGETPLDPPALETLPPEEAVTALTIEEHPAAVVSPPPVRRSSIPDFMDDQGSPSFPSPGQGVTMDFAHDGGLATTYLEDRDTSDEAGGGSALRMLRGWRDNAQRMHSARRTHPRSSAARHMPPAMLVILTIVILSTAAWVVLGRNLSAFDDRRSQATEAAMTPAQSLPVFVTASTLNCRSAPAREAGAVTILTRGTQVSAVARDREWVSLSYRGGQCWALGRYISVERPIVSRAPPSSQQRLV